jgi:D-hydroxyproline dehydrogenase subunit alpha
MTRFDVVVVGAGPAGMAAASTASRHGAGVCLIDDNATCGGQIWRGSDSPTHRHPAHGQFAQLQLALQDSRVELRSGTSVVANPAPNVLTVENVTGFENIRYRRLIIATGARERFLPFPGWTLPGVMGVGGLQAMVKGGLPIAEKRVVLAGSGPLLLAVAAGLTRNGARIVGIFEQASITKLTRFCAQLLRHPGKLREGAAYRASTLAVPYRTGSWVVEARGEGSLRSVAVSTNGSIHNYECDNLGCAFHLVPNLELPRLMNCEIQSGLVRVSETQQTSVNGVYCAGEPAGVGGLEKALCEGEIAGLACAERSATHLYRRRDLYAGFAQQLERTFALRAELQKVARPDTFVCRCEDVSREQLERMHSFREAKLHTRCGMGPCQGRICGPATEFLFGWDSAQTRPPIFPARVSTLAGAQEHVNQ